VLALSLPSEMGLAAALEGTALAQAVGTQVAAKAVGTALVSTALQTAQGVDLATAVQNAAVNATATTGSPYAANYVSDIVNSPGVANALTSAGVSTAATLAKGGNADDAWKNAVAAAGASGLSPEVGRTAATALATYAATGDAAGAAAAAAAAEAGGKPKAAPEPTPEPAPETATTPVEEITVSAPEKKLPLLFLKLPPVEVKAKREEQPAYISDLPSAGEVKVTATRPDKPTLITDVPEISITEKRDTTQPTTQEAKQANAQDRRVGEDLFIFSGQYPGGGALSQALGTSFQAPYASSAGTSGLTAYREAGEIEGTETGGKRRNVWNEESLRLKDALGL